MDRRKIIKSLFGLGIIHNKTYNNKEMSLINWFNINKTCKVLQEEREYIKYLCNLSGKIREKSIQVESTRIYSLQKLTSHNVIRFISKYKTYTFSYNASVIIKNMKIQVYPNKNNYPEIYEEFELI